MRLLLPFQPLVSSLLCKVTRAGAVAELGAGVGDFKVLACINEVELASKVHAVLYGVVEGDVTGDDDRDSDLRIVGDRISVT